MNYSNKNLFQYQYNRRIFNLNRLKQQAEVSVDLTLQRCNIYIGNIAKK